MNKKKVVVVGGGGHAKVVVDILNRSSIYEVIGCTDQVVNQEVLNVKVLGDDTILTELYSTGVHCAIIAIGDNKLRAKLAQKLKEIGFEMISAISPNAHISEYTHLGEGVVVMPGAVINAGAWIGDHVIINTNASIDHDSRIEDYSHIAPGCNIAGNVTIGKGTFAGIGTKVIDRITIGNWCILGAGTVIIKPVPSFTLSVGVPGKVIKNFDQAR